MREMNKEQAINKSQVSDKVMTAIGLMSGTSLDGVDVALLKTDGMNIIEHGPTLHYPYPRMTKVSIQRAIRLVLEGREGGDDMARAVDDVTTAHITAVRRLMEKNRLYRDEIDVIGFHGQTILHRPAKSAESIGRTLQIGSGRVLSDELRIDVVDGFRHQDVAAGGEGAPFAPIYHNALVKKLGRHHPVAILNLGGVANVTYIPKGADPEKMIAFDCGPGNGLVDEWVNFHTGAAMDKDGALARQGVVHEETVKLMCLNPYLRRPAPKSLDRYDFKTDAVKNMSVADGAATLTAFTAAAVRASSERILPEQPLEWIVVGGGAHNPYLMELLVNRLDALVVKAVDVGWRGDDLEAECFAYLAVRSLKKLPLSYPKTTRVPHPMTGGNYCRAPV